MKNLERTAPNIEICAYKRIRGRHPNYYICQITDCGRAETRLVRRKLRFHFRVANRPGNQETARPTLDMGAPRMGISSNTNWGHPLLDTRHAYAEINGRGMPYVSPSLLSPLGFGLGRESPLQRRKAKECAFMRIWREASRANRIHYAHPQTFPYHRKQN